MMSLIITAVSIILVAVLAVATIYWIGESTTEASLKAKVAKVLNQASQISAANEMFKNDKMQIHAPSIQALVDDGYLRQTPGDGWTIDQATDQIVLVGNDVDVKVCYRINKTLRGMNYAYACPESHRFPGHAIWVNP